MMLSQKTEEELKRLEGLSVKDLRRQAALRDVPLCQIGAAIEKADLIKMILRAPPVLDHYDVGTGVKIHTAESIAAAKTLPPKVKKRKKKKKRYSSSTSRSSGSRSSRSRKGGRRKRSKSRHRSRSQKRKRSKSRSPSLIMITSVPSAVQPRPPRAARAGTANGVQKTAQGAGALAIADASSIVPAADVQAAKQQEGMAAAAALGFDVLPKAPAASASAPALGLRPSINSGAPAPYGAAQLPGGRVCISYLCTAKCDMGTNCPDAHIIDPEEEMRVRARFKEQMCHFGASCTRSGCLFRHPGEKLDEVNLVPEGQQVMLKATPQGMQLQYM